jgi:cbb3-type cytochrome oxidase maturation protein
MSVILILILASLALAATFLAGFIWAVRSGQFEDTHTPSLRVLLDDTAAKISTTTSKTNKS